MTIAPQRKSSNLRLSFNMFFHDRFEAVYGIDTNYQDDLYEVGGKKLWASVSFLSDGAGRKGFTMVQVDVFSRSLGRGADDDRYLESRDETIDKVHAALHVDDIPVYDFANPSVPTLVPGAKLVVQNSGGTFREPEDDRTFDTVDGVARRCLTYRLRLLTDWARAQSYFE